MSSNDTISSTNGSFSSSTKEHNISAALLISGIAVFMAFENFLVVYAVAIKKFRRVPDILIFSLSVSAITNSFTVLVIAAYHRAVDSNGVDGINTLCKVQSWFVVTLRISDVFTTTLISIDRYIATTKPFYYRANVTPMHGWTAILVTPVISGFISILPFVGFGAVGRDTASLCVISWDSAVSFLIVTIAYIQFIIVLYCYIAVILAIKKLIKRQKAIVRSQTISYESPSLSHRTTNSNVSLNLSHGTNSTASSPENTPVFTVRSVNLRKMALNRSLSNFEGSHSEVFGMRSPEFPTKTSTHLEIPDHTKGKLRRAATSPEERPRARSPSPSGHPRAHTASPVVLPKARSASPGEFSKTRTSSGELSSTRSASIRAANHTLSSESIIQSNSFSSWDRFRPNVNKHVSSLRKKWVGSFLHRAQNEERRQWRESEQFAKIMGVVVLMFYISWLPLAVSFDFGILFL